MIQCIILTKLLLLLIQCNIDLIRFIINDWNTARLPVARIILGSAIDDFWLQNPVWSSSTPILSCQCAFEPQETLPFHGLFSEQFRSSFGALSEQMGVVTSQKGHFFVCLFFLREHEHGQTSLEAKESQSKWPTVRDNVLSAASQSAVGQRSADGVFLLFLLPVLCFFYGFNNLIDRDDVKKKMWKAKPGLGLLVFWVFGDLMILKIR